MDDKVRIQESLSKIMEIGVAALENGSAVKIKVVGDSMCPLLHGGGDSVTLKSVKKAKLFDVILFKRKDGQYVLHRVVRKNRDFLSFAGDFEIKREEPIFENQIIAKAIEFERCGRKFSANNLLYRLYSVVWTWFLPHRHRIIYKAKLLKRKAEKCFK